MACPESGAVIRTNTKSSAALVTMSALRVVSAASRITSTAGPVTRPAAWSWSKMSGIRRTP